MVLKHSFRLALLVVCILSFAAAKDSKPGGVSGRLAIRTPDGKEIPGYRAKAYLLYSGSGKGQGKMEIKQNCVNSRCTKRAFVDGKEVDITGLQTDQEIYQAMKTPSEYFGEEQSRQLQQYLNAESRTNQRLASGQPYTKADEDADCLDKMAINERAIMATEKWAVESRKTDQMFTVESSEDGKFTFDAVPEGNYIFYAYGSAADTHVFWSAYGITVKSGKLTAVDAPRMDAACPPL